jgi:NADH-quinone oxidoreductase subunit G
LIPFAWSPGWNSYQAWNKFQEEIAGPLRSGNPGVRLFENPAQPADYFRDRPSKFQAREGEWLIVPLCHVFGSEELSIHSPGIKQLSPQPYIAVNDADAQRLGWTSGSAVEFAIDGENFRASVQVRPDLPDGVAGIPTGIPPFLGVHIPAWSRIVRAS